MTVKKSIVEMETLTEQLRFAFCVKGFDDKERAQQNVLLYAEWKMRETEYREFFEAGSEQYRFFCNEFVKEIKLSPTNNYKKREALQ